MRGDGCFDAARRRMAMRPKELVAIVRENGFVDAICNALSFNLLGQNVFPAAADTVQFSESRSIPASNNTRYQLIMIAADPIYEWIVNGEVDRHDIILMLG